MSSRHPSDHQAGSPEIRSELSIAADADLQVTRTPGRREGPILVTLFSVRDSPTMSNAKARGQRSQFKWICAGQSLFAGSGCFPMEASQVIHGISECTFCHIFARACYPMDVFGR